MTKRNATVAVASVLLVVAVAVVVLLPVPYVTMRPGPTRDVLAMGGGKTVIEIDGRKTYPTEGSLRLTTVSVTSPGDSVGIAEVVRAWIAPDEAVVPRDAVYAPSKSAEEAEQESATQMADSQNVAAAAALRLLGDDIPEHAVVMAVNDDAPAAGVLEVDDVIVGVDGKPTATAAATVAAIRDRSIGDEVELTIRRGDAEQQVRMATTGLRNPETGRRFPAVGITPGVIYDLPIDVRIKLSGGIGGPSAGTIFALAIYDELTPGALTGGASVAGTGEITADGAVGPIGGIQQKVVGAADAGAEVFLVPAANCAGALGADVDPDDITLVRVDDLRGAVQALEALADDPAAEVPECG
ncbi:PDZ domain-containing protein [soil metagenome]